MSTRYHMTPKGPKKCEAKSQDTCKYGNMIHSTDKAQLDALYESDMKKVDDLRVELTAAAKSYYQDLSDSGLTDEEYDTKQAYLSSLVSTYEIDDPEVSALLEGEVAGGVKTKARPNVSGSDDDSIVHHDVPMLSLAKAKTRDVVVKYCGNMLEHGATGFKLQAKLDGLACSAVYENGQLSKMSTRGDGSDGEDMSYLIHNSDVTVKGLPKSLTGKLAGKNVEIRGELFLRPSDFKNADAGRQAAGQGAFANYRNANAGIVRKAAGGLGYKATLTFVMYKIVGSTKEQDLVDSGVLEVSRVTQDEWSKVGVPAPLEVSADGKEAASVVNETMKTVDAFGPVRPDLDIPTDGIVIKPVNEQEMDHKMGSNAHNPLSQLAWKYSGAKADATVVGVSFSVGKSGRVTPTLEFAPVELDGSTVSKATLHNTSFLDENDIRVGSVVSIEKSNDVIPHFLGTVWTNEDAERIHPLKNCPVCGSKIAYGDKLSYCMNKNCPSRTSYMLKSSASKGLFDLDGLGGETISALYDSGTVNDVSDWFHLSEDQLADVQTGTTSSGSAKTFGRTRAKHVMEQIDRARHETPAYKTMASLAIDGMGRRMSKSLLDEFHTVDALRGASEEELSQVPGVGTERARVIHEGLIEKASLIDKLADAGLPMSQEASTKKLADNTDDPAAAAVSGATFSISGAVPEGWANRGEWQSWIEAMGGNAASAPNAKTDYMVGDPNSSSSKIKKAAKLGVKIITPDEFLHLIGRE